MNIKALLTGSVSALALVALAGCTSGAVAAGPPVDPASATAGSPSATAGSPSATVGSPSPTAGSPSATVGSPSATAGSGTPTAGPQSPTPSAEEKLTRALMLQRTDFGDAGFGSGAGLESFGTGGPKTPTVPCGGDGLAGLTEGDAQVVHATYTGHDISASEEISQVASPSYGKRFFDRAASAQEGCGRTTRGTLVAGSVHRVAVDGGAAQWYVLTGQDGRAVADVAVIRLGARFGVLRVDGETINPSAMGSLTRAAAYRLGD